ncbi:MAG TPA: alpha/beta hydrolase [Clostridia bacterium]|nr:alpha/beta hydrolase [Clostridia bacterium]
MAEAIPVLEKIKRRRGLKIIKIFSIGVLVILLAGFALTPPLIMKDMVFLHADCKAAQPSEYGIAADETKLVTEDDFDLVSWEVKASRPKAIVIFLSGIHKPSVTAFFGHARLLSENSYSSLLIEMRSHGKSEGNQIYLGMKEYLDVKAGVDYIRSKEEYKDVPIVVFGLSMGAATAINATGEIEEIDGLISASAFSSWPDVFCDSMANMGAPEWLAAAEKPFVWLYLGFEYGFGNLDINPLKEIEKLNGRPALLMHSKGDSEVPYKSFERLMAVAPKQVSTYVCEGDYHFICRKEFRDPMSDADYANTVLDFLKKNFH